MPSAKSARVSERKRRRNAPLRSQAKTSVAKARRLIDADSPEDAGKAATEAVSFLDKAAQKGVIHRGNAARRKSRLMKQLARSRSP